MARTELDIYVEHSQGVQDQVTLANENLDAGELAIKGLTSLAITGDAVLSNAQQRPAILLLQGTPGAPFSLTTAPHSNRWTAINLTDSDASFLALGQVSNVPVVPAGATAALVCDGSKVRVVGASGGGTWGSITGTLSDQLDLQIELDGKEPVIAAGTTGQYWRGDKTWQTLSKTAVGLGNVDNTSDASKPISTATQNALNLKADLVGGLVPSSQLPAYVDDVLEFANFAALPGTGAASIIYVTLDDNKTYRWSGSAYVEISASLALGETSATAYRGDRGKVAYDFSQLLTTRGDLLTRNATDNVRLALGAANRVLRSNGTDAVWGQVDAANDVTGLLAPANGGSGTANTGNLAWPSGGGTAALLGTANAFTDDNTFKSVGITGTGGLGFVKYAAQSSTPAAPASGFTNFADSLGRFSWRRASDGFMRTWDATLTADRVFTLPDASITVAGKEIDNAFSTAQTINAVAVAGTGETILTCTVSDAASDYLKLSNSTTANGTFGPVFFGNVDTVATKRSLYFVAQCLAANDTGTTPMMTIDSRQSAAQIATRPLLTIESFAVEKARFDGTGQFGLGTNAPGALLHVRLNNATTAAIDSVAIIGHDSTGTPAVGFGADWRGRLKSSTTTGQEAMRLRWYWDTATHASRKAGAALSIWDTAERDCLTFSSDGSRGSVGVGGATIAGRLTLPQGTATAGTAPLVFIAGTNLTSAVAGAMEYDGTDLFFSPSTTRKKVVLAPTSPSAYVVTNGTTDRTFDANATSIDELSDIIATLIVDLQAAKVIG